MIHKILQDLFNLAVAAAVLSYFVWMCYHCCQTKPRPQPIRPHRRRRY